MSTKYPGNGEACDSCDGPLGRRFYFCEKCDPACRA